MAVFLADCSMFDRIFEKIQSETLRWVGYNAQQAFSQVEEYFKIPEPTAPFELIRRFDPSSDRLLSQGCISVEGDAWRIEAYDRQNSSFSSNLNTNLFDSVRNVVLFEIPDRLTSERVVACRARIKTASLQQGVSLQLSHVQQRSDLDWLGSFTYSPLRSITLPGGDLDWGIYEVRQHFESTATPGKIKIQLDFKGSGTFWIKNIELLQAPLKSL